MRRSEKKNIERLEKALRVAHANRAIAELSPEWRQRVMRDIQNLHVDTKIEDRGSFRRIVLPFASATALAAMVLLFFASGSIMSIDYDILEFLLEDYTGLFSHSLLDL